MVIQSHSALLFDTIGEHVCLCAALVGKVQSVHIMPYTFLARNAARMGMLSMAVSLLSLSLM